MAMLLGGCVLAFAGAVLLLFGLIGALLDGLFAPHVPAALLLAYGAVLAAAGFWLARFGRKRIGAATPRRPS